MENACIQQEQPHRCAASQAPDGPCHPVGGKQKGVPMSKIDKKLLMLIKSLTKEQKEFIFHFIQYFFKADLQ